MAVEDKLLAQYREQVWKIAAEQVFLRVQRLRGALERIALETGTPAAQKALDEDEEYCNG